MFSMFIEAAWKVTLAGLVLGAGLPALFALGVRFTAAGSAGGLTVAEATPRPAFRALGIVCFVVVAALVILGITVIIAAGLGKTVSFDHVYPTLVPKD